MGTTSGSPRVTARRAATRETILAAAWDLARDEGLTVFTMRDLAARVGMRAPSLYEYFSGKDANYEAMFAQATARSSPPSEICRARPRSVRVRA